MHTPRGSMHYLDVAGTEEAVSVIDGHEEVSKDDADDGHELHNNVERGARCVLEGVANSVTHNSSGVGRRLLPSVEALAAVNRHDGLITRHDLDVAGLVCLLNVRQPLLDGDLALRRPDAHLLRHASVAVVALSSIPPLSLIDRAPVPERKPPVELALLGILLGIVPCTSSVGHGDGELHRGGDRTREKASNGLQQQKQTQGTAGNCVRNGFAVSPCWRALGW